VTLLARRYGTVIGRHGRKYRDIAGLRLAGNLDTLHSSCAGKVQLINQIMAALQERHLNCHLTKYLLDTPLNHSCSVPSYHLLHTGTISFLSIFICSPAEVFV